MVGRRTVPFFQCRVRGHGCGRTSVSRALGVDGGVMGGYTHACARPLWRIFAGCDCIGWSQWVWDAIVVMGSEREVCNLMCKSCPRVGAEVYPLAFYWVLFLRTRKGSFHRPVPTIYTLKLVSFGSKKIGSIYRQRS